MTIDSEVKAAYHVARVTVEGLATDESLYPFSTHSGMWDPVQKKAWAALRAASTALDLRAPTRGDVPKEDLTIIRDKSYNDVPYRKLIAGPYHLYYRPSNANTQIPQQAADSFNKTNALYEKAGFPIVKPVQVRITGGGGSTRAFYYWSNLSDWSEMRIPPSAVKSSYGKGHIDASTIHETAHMYHKEILRDGFENNRILTRYALVKNEKSPHGDNKKKNKGAQYTDERKSLMSEARKHIEEGGLPEAFDKTWFLMKLDKNAPVSRDIQSGYFKGYISNIVETNNQTDFFYKVTVGVYVLDPADPKKKKVKKLYDMDVRLNTLLGMIQPEKHIDKRSKAVYEKLLPHIEKAKKALAEANDTDFRHRNGKWISKWIPTEYGRTNHKEWFAEMLTMYLQWPEKVDPEVLEFIESLKNEIRKDVDTRPQAHPTRPA